MKTFPKILMLACAFAAAALTAPSAFAHVTYYRLAPGATGTQTGQVGTTPGNGWTGGVNADVLALQSIISNSPNDLGYEGVHSATNDRYIATGLYAPTAVGSTPATSLDPNGTWAGVVTSNSATLLGQTYAYNNNGTYNPGNANPMSSTGALSVDQGSWLNGVSSTNTGLSSGSPHFSSGSGNPELNLLTNIGGTGYINITVGDDPLFAGTNQLAFAIYQGWSDSASFLTDHNPLYTGVASSAGQDIGVSLQLTGNFNGSYQTAANAGEYTLVFGDVSDAVDFSLNSLIYDGRYRYALDISTTAAYSTIVAAAVPVPGAVWLFGGALASLFRFGRRSAIAA